MKILVTNDDGIFSLGIETLISVAKEFGDVFVVAPQSEQSGVSHSITLTRPLRARHIGKQTWTVEGTPSDCVFLAINHLLDDCPDLVLSGINRGPNLGFDTLYSGTVAGAMEGTIQGTHGIAFSLSALYSFPFDAIRGHVQTVLSRILQQGIPDGITLNVNIPSPEEGPIRGVQVTRLGERVFSTSIVARTDPRKEGYFWIGGERMEVQAGGDTDTGAVAAGYISVTPLTPSLMSTSTMNQIHAYGTTFRRN